MANFFAKVLGKFFGSKHEKDVEAIRPIVAEVNEHFEAYASLSNDELRNKTLEFRERIAHYLEAIDAEIASLEEQVQNDEELDLEQKEATYQQIDKLKKDRDKALEDILLEMLPEAFATMKETARRFTQNEHISAKATELDRQLAVTRPHIKIQGDEVVYANEWLAAGTPIKWDMIHYDVQIIGGKVLHDGKIAEMRTGEGKTLVSTLPVYLNALAGQGVHLVTVNDYLARRDSEWNAPLFNFLGLTVGCIDAHRPNSDERRDAYHCDITYGTNNEFGFDYLRDNMVRTPEEMVQRKFHFAIVDEVDSVLIDDARTPLIISGPIDSTDEQDFYELKPRIQKLFETQSKLVSRLIADAKKLLAEGNDGSDEGQGGLALLRAHRALPKNNAIIKLLSEQGAKQTLLKTEGYYLQNNSEKMPLCDKELYFVIDEKNNTIDLTEKGIELITAGGEEKDFFVMPDVGSEVAEIERSAATHEEKLQLKDKLMREFAVKSERLHSVQQLLKAYALFEKEVDYIVVDQKVMIVDENTGRVLDGRRYSDGLHQAIEAKENVKVQSATQTWATVTLQNFFRMYHKLAGMTGTAETEAGEFWDIYKLDVVEIPTNKPVIRQDMEDMVYKTKREKYAALIDEVVKLKEAGRPVLVGTTSVEVSELLSGILNRRKIPHNVLNAKQHQREAEIVAEAGRAGQITIATNMAGRGTDIKISPEVIAAGGLAIIGSERHDSRRIDRQLRGRAGRQGDPGSSLFFVSLEDELMRLFGSDRIAKFMDRFGHEEGEAIQHSMITSSIERAQKKVEENNFGIRKRLLEYDDVMNKQRNAIYEKRRHALFGERLQVDILNGFYDLSSHIVATQKNGGNYEYFSLDLIRYFSMDTPVTEQEFEHTKADQLTQQVYDAVLEQYKRKCDRIVNTTLPVLQGMHQEQGHQIKNVVIPFTDGKAELQVLVNLEKVLQNKGKEVVTASEKNITLALIDEAWKHHLRNMDDLKQEVQNASYEQKDPLLIYKLEAFNIFDNMLLETTREVSSFLMKAELPGSSGQDQMREARQQKRTDMDNLKATRDNNNGLVQGAGPQTSDAQQSVQQKVEKPEPVKVGPKVGRNDPCPCGSGKKYKKCHGIGEE
jgi:preprotein translocase subunit SecA